MQNVNQIHICQVNLDISESPIEINGALENIQGNLTGRQIMSHKRHVIPRPHRRAMGYFWRVFWRKMIVS